jgi:hypothetical protein
MNECEFCGPNPDLPNHDKAEHDRLARIYYQVDHLVTQSWDGVPLYEKRNIVDVLKNLTSKWKAQLGHEATEGGRR